MFKICFFWDGRYSGCVMLGIRDFRFEEYLGCRAFGMQDLECWMFAGVWVFGLQNAKKSNYKDEIKKLCSQINEKKKKKILIKQTENLILFLLW